MPRSRADDFEDKRNNILNVAAALFAEHGYTGTKMEQIAEHCNVSKSMLYHYFEKKEDVLFDILQEHVRRLIRLVEAHIKANTGADNEEFFRGFVQVWLEPSSDVRARHVVAMVDMRYLTDKQKVKQIKLEKRLLDLASEVLTKLNPHVGPVERRAYCLLLIGMMNWIELWYKQSGRISPSELYKMIGHLFMQGFLDAPEKTAKRSTGRA